MPVDIAVRLDEKRDLSNDIAKVRYVDTGDNMWCPAMVIDANSYQNISTATTATVKSGPGTLNSLVFNTVVPLLVVTVYDSLSASGSVIASITLPTTLLAPEPLRMYNLKFTNGLTIVTSLISNLTITYR